MTSHKSIEAEVLAAEIKGYAKQQASQTRDIIKHDRRVTVRALAKALDIERIERRCTQTQMTKWLTNIDRRLKVLEADDA